MGAIQKRLQKLEHSMAIRHADYGPAWDRLFKEFDVPSNLPVPEHMPIVIKIVNLDMTEHSRKLMVGGSMFDRLPSNHPVVLSEVKAVDPGTLACRHEQLEASK